MKKNKFSRISLIFPSSYRMISFSIGFLSNILTTVLALSLYKLISLAITEEVAYFMHVRLLGTMIPTILFFLPVQEKMKSYFSSYFLSEYLYDDADSIKQAYKRFDINALIKNVFPEMVSISGSASGRLAILNLPNDSYDIFLFSRGRQKKVKTRNEKIDLRLIQYLETRKRGVSIADTVLEPEINTDFIALKSNYILPFLFRERIFGFLALSNIPSTQALTDLTLLSSKAAIAIYNHILSDQVAEGKKYKREMEIADRIHSLIRPISQPEVKNFRFKDETEKTNVLMEFLQSGDKTILSFLYMDSSRKGHGIVLSYLLGIIYSYSWVSEKITISSIRDELQASLKNLDWTEPIDLLIGEIDAQTGAFTVIVEGYNFSIVRENPERNLISLGWRNNLEFNSLPFQICLKGKRIFSIEKRTE